MKVLSRKRHVSKRHILTLNNNGHSLSEKTHSEFHTLAHFFQQYLVQSVSSTASLFLGGSDVMDFECLLRVYFSLFNVLFPLHWCYKVHNQCY